MKSVKYNIYVLFLLGMVTILSPFCSMAAMPDKTFTVVIDPGHGGKDIGAADNKAREKDINLGVALQLQSLIKNKMKDANVVMTRDDDTYLTLQERADIANKSKGDIFISIHTNSVDKKNRNRRNIAGSSVYALGLHKDDNNMMVARRENSVIELEQNYEQKYSGFDPSKDESYIIFEMAQKKNLSKSIRFAEEAQKQLTGVGRGNRGVHQAGFWVLWATSMPSVLVELDFICNPESAKYLDSEKGQKELASALFKALENYYESWQKSSGKVNVASVASPDAIVDDNVSSRIVVASKKSVSSRDDVAPSVTSNVGNVGKRRRRNDVARRNSAMRSVETADIPVVNHTTRTLVENESESFEITNHGDENLVAKDSAKKKKEKKSKDSKKKESRAPSAHNAKIEKFVKVYRIQVLASDELLKQNNARFGGLKPITTYRENNLYKYYYEESTNRDEIEKVLQRVRKIIPDAFVVETMKSVGTSK